MKTSTVILRSVAALLGVAILFWAVRLYHQGAGISATALLILEGTAIVAGVLFERKRYSPKVDTTSGQWQETGERFMDPVSGRMTKVIYNPKSGERDYIDDQSKSVQVKN